MGGLLARIAICVAACALFAISAAEVRAQGYPERPVHILAGFAPGGSSDIVTCARNHDARPARREMRTQVEQEILRWRHTVEARHIERQ